MVGIASHRGGAFLWPENSLEAFRASARLPIEQADRTAIGKAMAGHH